MDEIVNKVANSSLITIDLEEFIDRDQPRSIIDLKDHLFEGMIIREGDIRNFVKEEDWSKYKGHVVGVYCSSDAIIPVWAYMLISSRLSGIARKIVIGNDDRITEEMFLEKFNAIDPETYRGAKIVIKGCGDFHIPESCYSTITERLSSVASSIMYGEPCSTVPIIKNRGKN